MKIEIYKHKNQIALLRDDWDLLFDNGEYSVFQSFVYCFNSLNSDSRPFVICLFNKNKIQEIWPLEFISNKLRFINDTHADYCDILSKTDSPLVREYLVSMKHIGKLRLRNLKSESNVIDKIHNISFSDFHLSLKFSILSLLKTESFPSNFNHFVYRQKRRLKRILNKYSCDHLIYENHFNNFPIKEIVDLRNCMILKKKRNKGFLEDNFLLLVESLYNSGLLIVSIIKSKDVVLAISLIFKKDNNYTFWIDIFGEKPMINLYHNTLFLKNITEASDASFDFGRGDYNYKIQNYSPEFFDLFELNTFENYFERFLFRIFRFNKKIMNHCYKTIIR